MLTFFHVISWLLVIAIYGYNFEEDKQNAVLHNCTSQSLRNSNSTNTDYEQEDVTSYLRKHFQDSRLIKHNYFFHDTQPARPPGCSPCPPLRKPGPFCHARMDLGFVVEASASVEKHGKGNFRRILDFVEMTVRKFSISRRKTRVGVVTYGATTDLVVDFESQQRKSSMVRALQKASTQSLPSSNTGYALGMAGHRLFNRKFNTRKDVPKVLIVITDGRSTDSVTDPAHRLKHCGVRIYGVGVGYNFDIKQLEMMSSRPVSENVFIGPFNKLQYIRDDLVRSVCYGVGGFLKKPGNKQCLCKQGSKKPICNSDVSKSTEEDIHF
ncbi:hypothetical protein ACROYT_G010204 [Oculina patagonica]